MILNDNGKKRELTFLFKFILNDLLTNTSLEGHVR